MVVAEDMAEGVEMKESGAEFLSIQKKGRTLFVELKVSNCSRCGKNHRSILFREFKQPHETGYNSFGFCPATKDPILMRMELNKQEVLDKYGEPGLKKWEARK